MTVWTRMNFRDYFAFHRISEEAVILAVKSRVGLNADEFFFMSGSLAESLGNHQSDLDVCLITNRDLSGKQIGPLVPIALGGGSVDLEWCSPSFVDNAISKINGFSFQDSRNAFTVARSTLEFVHRFTVGKGLHGLTRYQKIKSLLNRSNISQLLIQEAVAEATALQIDLLGAIEVSDWNTAAFVTDELIGFIVQALLAAHGNTNPSEKWRWRKLLEINSIISQSDMLGGPLMPSAYALLSELRLDVTPVPSRSSERARRVVHLANRVLPTCQVGLLSQDIKNLLPHTGPLNATDSGGKTSPSVGDDDVLPSLPLDFGIRIRDGEYHGFRIVGDVDFVISRSAAEILLGFDGSTTMEELVSRSARLTGEDTSATAASILSMKALLSAHKLLPEALEKKLGELLSFPT